MAPNNDEQPLEDHFPINPSLEDISHPASRYIQQHGPPSLYLPGFGGMLDQNVPRNQLAPKAKPRAPIAKKLLDNIPKHDYVLPNGGAINATVTEIIAILPHWYRNLNILTRFLNNGMNASVHLAILNEYRHLNVPVVGDRRRVQERLSDAYRKTMRKVIPGWTQAKHQAPVGWNQANVGIARHVPEAARENGYIAPSSIPFKDLAIGLKKLPHGNDAGDLTRALDYAMRNRKIDEQGQEVELMFPEDIQAILSQIGRTRITPAHNDRHILARYANVRHEASGRRKQLAGEQKQRKLADQVDALNEGQFHSHRLPQPTFMTQGPYRAQQEPLSDPFQDMGYGVGTLHDTGYGLTFPPQYPRSASQEAAAAVASELLYHGAEQAVSDSPQLDFSGVDFSDIEFPAIPAFHNLDGEPDSNIHVPDWSDLNPEESAREMENLMASFSTPYEESELPTGVGSFDFDEWETEFNTANLPTPAPSSPPPAQLLANCPEGLDEDYHSDLARASRWARQNPGMRFKIGDVGRIVYMLDTMDREDMKASISAAPGTAEDLMEVGDEQPREGLQVPTQKEPTEEETEREDLQAVVSQHENAIGEDIEGGMKRHWEEMGAE
jgi:hypothetical protein